MQRTSHEEAHPSTLKSVQGTLEGIDAGHNCPLIQLFSPVDNSVKILATVQFATKFSSLSKITLVHFPHLMTYFRHLCITAVSGVL